MNRVYFKDITSSQRGGLRTTASPLDSAVPAFLDIGSTVPGLMSPHPQRKLQACLSKGKLRPYRPDEHLYTAGPPRDQPRSKLGRPQCSFSLTPDETRYAYPSVMWRYQPSYHTGQKRNCQGR